MLFYGGYVFASCVIHNVVWLIDMPLRDEEICRGVGYIFEATCDWLLANKLYASKVGLQKAIILYTIMAFR